MTQPSFWCVANLGDANPFEHGGQFLCVDRTGVYPPELVVIESLGSDEKRFKYIIQLERLTAVKDNDCAIIGVSDNKYHVNHTAWFGDIAALKNAANHIGISIEQFIEKLLSSKPVDNAVAYKALSDYHGYMNFDSSGDFISSDKARFMCDRFLAQIEETKTWHEGFFQT